MRRFISIVLSLLAATSAFASGFQVTAQGARSLGMGLAFTPVADDASTIYYNAGGLGFLGRDYVIGAMVAHNLEGNFTGTSGTAEDQFKGYTLVPEIYLAHAFGRVHAGLGVYAPFGLPMRWDDPRAFSGRRAATTATLRTINIDPSAALELTPNLSIGVGADWVHSKVQLERIAAIPVGPALVDVEEARLKSDIADTSAWGWNAGLLWKSGALRLGVSYRSGLDLDHEGKLAFTPIATGSAQLDAIARTIFPATPIDSTVRLALPSSLNAGAAWMSGQTTVALEADRTQWSAFESLSIDAPAPFNSTRVTNWDDTWAWRVGVETLCGPIICRAGYYRDESPMPLADVGPILPDADRQGFTAGIGVSLGGRMSLDVGAAYVKFDERTTTATGTDRLAGRWKTTGSELAVNLHWR